MKHITIPCNHCNKEISISREQRYEISQHYRDATEKYKQATWKFVLEHSRKLKKSILCTFVITDKDNFEGRVFARVNGYERKDFEKVIYENVKSDILKNREIDYSKKRNIYLDKLAKKHLFLKFIFKLYKLI
jgi:hypothetical protein